MTKGSIVLVLLLAGCASSPDDVMLRPNAVEFRFAEASPQDGLISVVNHQDGTEAYVHREVLLSDRDISGAKVIEGKLGEPVVEIFFHPSGSARLRELSRENIGRSLAILANGELLVAVPVQGELNLPSVVLVASFGWDEAEQIVAKLNRVPAQHSKR